MKHEFKVSLVWLWTIQLFFFTLGVNAQELLPLQQIGTVQRVKPADIPASPFSLGCETLDRELWDPGEVYPWLEGLPVKWARLQTGWARTERVKGEYDWGWLDESVDGLVEIGIQPWFNVGYGNPHYTGGGARYHPMTNDQSMEAFKRFVAALTERYGEKISHWEIWNEPNLPQFWQPDQPDPARYAKLVAEIAPIIRKGVPEAVIIGGVTAGIPLEFIQGCLEGGVGDHIDVFSFHPYRTIPEQGYPEQIRALRELLDQYRPGILLWQGETGFPSAPNSTGFVGVGPWTEKIQAKIMLRRLMTDLSLHIPLTNWFIVIDLHDYPVGTGNINHKGMLKALPEIAPKLAFSSLQYLGSVIKGETGTRNSMILARLSPDSLSRGEILNMQKFGTDMNPGIYTTSLNSKDGPVLAYWQVEKARDEKVPEKVTISYWDGEGEGFSDPVLVDPLFGIIYEIPSVNRFGGELVRQESPGTQVFQQLPVSDYPLLIVEKQHVKLVK